MFCLGRFSLPMCTSLDKMIVWSHFCTTWEQDCFPVSLYWPWELFNYLIHIWKHTRTLNKESGTVRQKTSLKMKWRDDYRSPPTHHSSVYCSKSPICCLVVTEILCIKWFGGGSSFLFTHQSVSNYKNGLQLVNTVEVEIFLFSSLGWVMHSENCCLVLDMIFTLQLRNTSVDL